MGKLNEIIKDKSCTPSNPKKISMHCPKRKSTRLKNSPTPVTFLMFRLIG